MSNSSRPPLTNHRYGGHSAVSDDHSRQQYEEVGVAHLSMSQTSPYAPSGGNEPPGVEQHGMYGTARGSGKPAAPLAQTDAPVTSPASLGQFTSEGSGSGQDSARPLGKTQRLEVLDERMMALVDPHTVRVEEDNGMWVLHGRVRDAATKASIEALARECLATDALRNELAIDLGH